MAITHDDLQVLAQWDTPTICNALEITNPERRGWGFTVDPFAVLDADLPPIVGYARTAKIRAGSPDLSDGAKGMEARFPYYEYVASQNAPAVLLIEDVDPHPGIGAFWGEVHTAVHKGLGIAGCVTNGSFRDLTDSAPGFQILGGMVNPSHAFVHYIDFNCQVTVHGMTVNHGDIIHADQHGAVIVPEDAVKKIPAAVATISAKEKLILDAARRDDFSVEKLKAAISGGDIH